MIAAFLSNVFFSFLPDIAKNILGAIPNAIRKWQITRFFGRDAVSGDGLYVVVDPYTHPLPRAGNRYIKKFYGIKPDNSLIGEDDVLGVNVIRVINYALAFFARFRKFEQKINVCTDSEVRNLWDGTFICFGSSDSNIKTYQIENLPENNLCKLEWNKHGRRCFRVGQAVYDFEGREDVGIILRMNNSRSRNHVLFVCAGLGEWGTSGSAYYLFKNWKSIYKQTKQREFCKVIRVTVQSDESAREIAHVQA